MASNIDSDIPMAGELVAALPVRNNFTLAKSEITNLQRDKQNRLVSGDNIRTINGLSLLGSGDLTISGGGGGGAGTVVSVNTGVGLSGGPITNSGTISLANTTVIPGIYQGLTVDAQGRVVHALDMDYQTGPNVITALSAKQDTLISGVNIRTINGQSLLSPMTDLVISGGGGGTVTSIATGNGLTGGPIVSSGTISLTDTFVVPGSYQGITVDQQGRVTHAINRDFQTSADVNLAVSSKQDQLISGDNIRTINGLSLLGSGDLTIAGGDGGGSGTVTSVSAGVGLTGGPITSSGALSLDVPVVIGHGGTSGATRQTALDNLADASGTTQGVLSRSAAGAWSVQPAITGGTGTVTSVDTGQGLSGGPVTISGIISLDVPVTIAHGGTNGITRQQALDNLANASGSQAGTLQRNMAGAWSVSSVPSGDSFDSLGGFSGAVTGFLFRDPSGAWTLEATSNGYLSENNPTFTGVITGPGLRLEDSTAVPAVAGTLRYNAGKLEYHNGTSWLQVATDV